MYIRSSLAFSFTAGASEAKLCMGRTCAFTQAQTGCMRAGEERRGACARMIRTRVASAALVLDVPVSRVFTNTAPNP